MRRICLVGAAALLAAVCSALVPDSAARLSADDPPQPGETEPNPGEVIPPEPDNVKPQLVVETGGHTATILGAFFVPEEGKPQNARELITTSRDGSVRFWDVETGEALRVLYPPLGDVQASAYCPTTHTLALSGRQGKEPVILLLDVETNAIHLLKGHSGTGTALAFSPDGTRLAFTGPDVPLRVWDVADAAKVALLKEMSGKGSKAWDVVFHPTDKRVISGADDGAMIWDVEEGTSKLLKGHEKGIVAVAWSPDGKKIAVGGSGSLHVWDVASQTSTRMGDEHCSGVAFSPDSRKVLAVHKPGPRVILRDLEPRTRPVHLSLPEKFATRALAFSPDGTKVITAGGEKSEVFLSNASNGKPVHHDGLGGAGQMHFAAAWGEGGKSIAWGDTGGPPLFPGNKPLQQVFSLERLGLVPLPRKDSADLFARAQRAQLKRGNMTLERESDNHTVTVKKVGARPVSYKVAGAGPGRDTHVVCGSFVDDNRAVVGTAAGDLFLFDTTNGDRLCDFQGHLGPIGAVAVFEDKNHHYLLSAGTDKTLRIWDLQAARGAAKGASLPPWLSFFVAGGEWIAWTPQGYYAASPNGEHFVGWLKGNGPDKLATYYPAEQFRSTYYEPKVIAALLEKGGLEKALYLSDKAKGNPMPAPVQVDTVLPPQVTINEPARNGQILQQPRLVIQAQAESQTDEPIKAMQLFLDGVPYERDKGATPVQPPATKPQMQWDVQVPTGRHRFTVVAATEKSRGESEIWVNNVAPAPLPRLFVLAIGNNAYQNLKPLACAKKDAASLEKAFLDYSKGKPQLFGDVRTRVIADATQKATLGGFDWLKEQKMTADDVAVLFYSGHGDRDAQGKWWLMSVEADPKNFPQTAVSGAEMKQRLKELPCRRMLVLLDACHSGALGSEDLAVELKQPDCGVVVICSAMSEERSWENDKLGHGYFTQALVDGPAGKAGANPAGEITVSRLSVYVEETVPRDTDEKQHPVVGRPTTVRPFALAKP
jgi:WD40 repeat protein